MAELPRRKRLRLPEYDYGQTGTYFVTFCTEGRRHLLGTVGRDDLGAPAVHLSRCGTIVDSYIRSIPKAYSNVCLEKYVVMPNHVHLILRIMGNGAPGSSRPTQLLSRMIAAVKRFSNRDAGMNIWQSSFYDHVIRDDNDFLHTCTYIDTNPAKWAEDCYDMEGAR